jgi:hypothetical protein
MAINLHFPRRNVQESRIRMCNDQHGYVITVFVGATQRGIKRQRIPIIKIGLESAHPDRCVTLSTGPASREA